MNARNVIGWEIVLLLASILVFRSVWIFFDNMKWASSGAGLLVLFGAGLILSGMALRAIHKEK